MIRSPLEQIKYINSVSSEIADKYKSGLSVDKIQKEYRVGYPNLYAILKSHNIVKRGAGDWMRKYTFDKNYFDEIDSEDKAYWIGFITADGGIVKSGWGAEYKALSIQLSNIDYGHLEKFKKSIKSTHPIKRLFHKDGRVGCRIIICSKALVRSLGHHNIIPQKTLKTIASSNIPNGLLKHYWRGLVDGDGSIWETVSKKKSGKKYHLFGIGLVGDVGLIESFKNYCKGILNRPVNISYDKSNGLYKVAVYGKSAIKMIKNLYGDSNIYLDRKKTKSDNLLLKYDTQIAMDI